MVFTCQFCEPLNWQWIHLQCYSCSTLPGSEGPCSETEPGQQTLCEPPHNGCAILEGEISLYSFPMAFELRLVLFIGLSFWCSNICRDVRRWHSHVERVRWECRRVWVQMWNERRRTRQGQFSFGRRSEFDFSMYAVNRFPRHLSTCDLITNNIGLVWLIFP